MKLYFDESGDAGSLERKSNTKNFSLCIYAEDNFEETRNFLLKVRKDFNIKRREVKWYKMDKVMRSNFLKQKYNLDKNIFCIVCNKIKSKVFGEELFEDMLIDLIIKNKLSGKVFYDGDHLSKMLHKVSSTLKERNLKVRFINKSSTKEIGIQVSDLYAGLVKDNPDLDKLKIIKYQ